MHSLALFVVAASLGVDYGWQPTEDGHLEYIIQVDPSLVELLKQGQEITSEIHPDAQGVRRFRIQVGTAKLARENLPELAVQPEPEAEMPAKRPPVRAVADDSQREFQGAGPANDDPTDTPPRPAKRLLGGDFAFPDAPQDESPSGSSRKPFRLEPDPSEKPLAHRQVAHAEHLTSQGDQGTPTTTSASRDKTESTGAAPVAKSDSPKPWLPLIVTLALLFGSVGGNAYLAWLAKDFYSRYRALAQQLRGPQPIS